MAEAKDCPRCGLVNPPEAVRCVCRFDFPTGRVLGSLIPHGPNPVGPWTEVLLGCILATTGAVLGAVAGVAITAWSMTPDGAGCRLLVLPALVLGVAAGAVGVAAGAPVGGVIGAVASLVIVHRRRRAWRSRGRAEPPP